MFGSFSVGGKIDLQEIRKEKDLKNTEHDEQFYKNNGPQGPAKAHSPKPVPIKCKNFHSSIHGSVLFSINSLIKLKNQCSYYYKAKSGKRKKGRTALGRNKMAVQVVGTDQGYHDAGPAQHYAAHSCGKPMGG